MRKLHSWKAEPNRRTKCQPFRSSIGLCGRDGTPVDLFASLSSRLGCVCLDRAGPPNCEDEDFGETGHKTPNFGFDQGCSLFCCPACAPRELVSRLRLSRVPGLVTGQSPRQGPSDFLFSFAFTVPSQMPVCHTASHLFLLLNVMPRLCERVWLMLCVRSREWPAEVILRTTLGCYCWHAGFHNPSGRRLSARATAVEMSAVESVRTGLPSCITPRAEH